MTIQEAVEKYKLDKRRRWYSYSGNVDIATYNSFYNKWICSGMYFLYTRENCNIESYQPVNKPKPRIY